MIFYKFYNIYKWNILCNFIHTGRIFKVESFTMQLHFSTIECNLKFGKILEICFIGIHDFSF